MWDSFESSVIYLFGKSVFLSVYLLFSCNNQWISNFIILFYVSQVHIGFCIVAAVAPPIVFKGKSFTYGSWSILSVMFMLKFFFVFNEEAFWKGFLNMCWRFPFSILWNSGILSAIDVLGDHALVGVSISNLQNIPLWLMTWYFLILILPFYSDIWSELGYVWNQHIIIGNALWLNCNNGCFFAYRYSTSLDSDYSALSWCLVSGFFRSISITTFSYCSKLSCKFLSNGHCSSSNFLGFMCAASIHVLPRQW